MAGLGVALGYRYITMLRTAPKLVFAKYLCFQLVLTLGMLPQAPEKDSNLQITGGTVPDLQHIFGYFSLPASAATPGAAIGTPSLVHPNISPLTAQGTSPP